MSVWFWACRGTKRRRLNSVIIVLQSTLLQTCRCWRGSAGCEVNYTLGFWTRLQLCQSKFTNVELRTKPRYEFSLPQRANVLFAPSLARNGGWLALQKVLSFWHQSPGCFSKLGELWVIHWRWTSTSNNPSTKSTTWEAAVLNLFCIVDHHLKTFVFH